MCEKCGLMLPLVEGSAVYNHEDPEHDCGMDLNQSTPLGFEKVVKKLKKAKSVKNPWAVAWSMKNKGIKPKTEGRIYEIVSQLSRSEVQAAWEELFVKLGRVDLDELSNWLMAEPKTVERALPSHLIIDKFGNVVDKGLTTPIFVGRNRSERPTSR